MTDKKKEKEEKVAKKKAEVEKQREHERKKHVRPWDKNKLSARRDSSSSGSEDIEEWKPQKEYRPMSQGNFILSTFQSDFISSAKLFNLIYRRMEREATS